LDTTRNIKSGLDPFKILSVAMYVAAFAFILLALHITNHYLVYTSGPTRIIVLCLVAYCLFGSIVLAALACILMLQRHILSEIQLLQIPVVSIRTRTDRVNTDNVVAIGGNRQRH